MNSSWSDGLKDRKCTLRPRRTVQPLYVFGFHVGNVLGLKLNPVPLSIPQRSLHLPLRLGAKVGGCVVMREMRVFPCMQGCGSIQRAQPSHLSEGVGHIAQLVLDLLEQQLVRLANTVAPVLRYAAHPPARPRRGLLRSACDKLDKHMGWES